MSEDWRDEAICAQMDGDFWFPNDGDWHTAQRAIEVCNTCPVRENCLQYALDAGEREGIYGGKTPRQRMRIRSAA